MTSLTKTALGCLGVAIASSLTLTQPASAQSAPQKETQTSASALGGPLTPSNPTLFQAQDGSATATIKLEDKERALQAGKAPLAWQSEHLDDQRQFDSNFSLINVDLK